MPRRAKPRWHARVGKWFMNVGPRDEHGRATEVFAPASIGANAEAAAWAWFTAYQSQDEIGGGVGKPVTAADVCEGYLAWLEKRAEAGQVTDETYQGKRVHLGHFLAGRKNRLAAALTPDDVDAMVTDLLTRFAISYVSLICASVTSAFNWAVRAKKLESSPIAGFKVPSIPRTAERFAERAETAAFLWCTRRRRGAKRRGSLSARFAALSGLMARMLIHTGARPAELSRLWWDDIRWKAGVTSVGHEYAKAVIPFDRWKCGKKTGKPRTIYFTPLITRALRREFAKADRHPVNVFVRRGLGGEPSQPYGRLTSIRQTRRVRRRVIREVAKIRERIEKGEVVSASEVRLASFDFVDHGPRRVTNYKHRHTYASNLLMNGVDTVTVAELLGTSPAMIYRNYGHLLDGHLAAAAELSRRKRA